ncbi:MAG: ABC transporter substrate-binding protein [Deltaproteobacteria bacterium]|nr:ABC transporter substrate-binding protein [Deltaproteobacteria bacterium]
MWRRLYSLFFYSLLIPLFLLPSPVNIFSEEKRMDPTKTGGIYRRPLEFSPKTFDPALSVEMYSTTIIQQVFDGLVQFDKDLNVIPAIAKSWRISPDGLNYTFYLKEGVKFHNGREVTATDFVNSFTRILNPDTKSSSSDFFSRILGAKEFIETRSKEVKGLIALNKFTLKIILLEPYAPFISILAMKGAKVVPKEEVQKSGEYFGKSPVGTGPFKFVSMKEGEEIVLEANPDYFEGRPFLDKVVFRIFHGAPREKILAEFKEGGLEESFIPPGEIEEILKQRQYSSIQKPLLSLRFYSFNLRIKPLDNIRLRKAINVVIDKKSIISEIHKNQFNLAKGVLPLGMPGYNPEREPYPYNETLARNYLFESGYGKNGPPIEIWSASKSEAAQRELNEIKSKLNNIGIETTLHYETNWPNFLSMVRDNKFPVHIHAWYADFPDPDNFLGTLFHSKSKYNYTNYHNPKVDRLLDQARAERDYLKRMEMYRKIEEMILDDAPIVPMVNHLFQMVYQPHVRGVEVSALGGPYIPMKKIWLMK